MEYKISLLNLRIIPNSPVNREAFFKSILTSLGVEERNFIGASNGKFIFSSVAYEGFTIDLPFYEAINTNGFIVKIFRKGAETLEKKFGSMSTFLRGFLDTFTPVSLIICNRFDIETDYIPQYVPSECSESKSFVYFNSSRSSFKSRYKKGLLECSFSRRSAPILLDKLLCSDCEDFAFELQCFLDEIKPFDMKPHDIETLLTQKPRPSFATK